MRATPRFVVGCTLVLAGLVPAAATAQQASPAHAHMGHALDGFRDTPDSQGLLPAALAEAQVAVTHAGLAARDPGNLDAMKLHTRHVLHAVDASQIDAGPGAGYGVKKAASGAAQHIELAARAEGASDNVKTHATHIATSARNAVARADRIVELAKQVEAAASAAAAAPLVAEINTLAQQIVAGVDANGDGRIGWQEGEGGLETAATHGGLMKRGEGG